MYYGQIGDVCGVPAPLKYAEKMGRQAKSIGLKSEEIVLAHEHFDKSIHGLYFL
jgi:hypothetical protein